MTEQFDIRKEEYLSLRNEVENHLTELSNLERYCMLAAATAFAWVATNTTLQAPIAQIAWFIPVFLLIFGAARSASIGKQLDLIGGYIRTIEVKMFQASEDGWEHYFAKHGAELATRNRILFWSFFILLATVFSILGFCGTAHRAATSSVTAQNNSQNDTFPTPQKLPPLIIGDGQSGIKQGASFTKPGVPPTSKPIECVPKIPGLPSEPVSPPLASSPPMASSGFLGILADMALNAIKAAESKASDAALLPSVAATEFIKGFSGEAGKAPVNLFSDLIKAGFGKNTDRDISKEREEISSAILRVLIKDNPSSAPPIFLSCPENKTTMRNTLSEQVLFDTNESKLSGSTDHTIDRIRTFAQAHPASILLLSSNTDTTGSAARNRTLTKQRTDVVRARLISYGGIEPNRIFSADLATQSLPVITAQNMSEPLNRSVIIKVRD